MQTNLKHYHEREILADALASEQSTTILYNSAANSTLTPALHKLFINLLNDTHQNAFDLLTTLHDKGYHPAPPVDKHTLKQIRKSYS